MAFYGQIVEGQSSALAENMLNVLLFVYRCRKFEFYIVGLLWLYAQKLKLQAVDLLVLNVIIFR